MFNRIRDRFGTAGLIVSIMALVLALAGGAFAAAGLNSKQKSQVRAIASSSQTAAGCPSSPRPPCASEAAPSAVSTPPLRRGHPASGRRQHLLHLVAFPRSEFLKNAHIRTICTRPDFAADRCPAGAVYGTASVTTPLLDYPLTGNVYLRSSDNLLPDVVPDLRGPAHQPLRLESAGRTDSIRGGIRNTLDFVPDAPFSRAVVSMQGGNQGLLVNSRDICARAYRAVVRYRAHNGRAYVERPKMQVRCKGRKRKAKRRGDERGAKDSAVALRSAVR